MLAHRAHLPDAVLQSSACWWLFAVALCFLSHSAVPGNILITATVRLGWPVARALELSAALDWLESSLNLSQRDYDLWMSPQYRGRV